MSATVLGRAHSTPEIAKAQRSAGAELTYFDGIAAARTMLALEANAAALQRRLPHGWDFAPYAGGDLRGTSLRGANMLVPFHEVYAVGTDDGRPVCLPQLSYVSFISQARNEETGARGLVQRSDGRSRGVGGQTRMEPFASYPGHARQPLGRPRDPTGARRADEVEPDVLLETGSIERSDADGDPEGGRAQQMERR